MSISLESEVTTLLEQIRAGDTDARNRLIERVMPKLRQAAVALMRRERPDHILQPTALIDEAFLRLFQNNFLADAQDRAHFFGAVANAMRQVLIEHARSRAAQKRSGQWQRVPLDDAVETIEQNGVPLEPLHEALEQLASLSPRQAQVVELRYFGGHSIAEAAEILGVSKRTVEQDFRRARAFLQVRLQEENHRDTRAV